jgi:uncharacterized small protein (DUF1192 family)
MIDPGMLPEIEAHLAPRLDGMFGARLMLRLTDDVVRKLSRDVLDNLVYRFGNLEEHVGALYAQIADLQARLQAIEAKSEAANVGSA